MSKDRNGHQYLFLLIATFVVFSIGFVVTEKSSARMKPPASPDICQQVSQNVRDMVAMPSPCSTDSECSFMPIACGMGCPSVNQIDKARIEDELSKRPGNCMCTMEACMEANAICESGICKSVPLMN